MSTRQRGPSARTRRRSSVSSGAWSASARATYSASGALKESRSCHARSSNGRWSTRVAGQDSRSSIAWWAAVRSSSPRRRVRRTTPSTSASTRWGAAWSGSSSKRSRTGSASGPASTTSATHEASTTSIAQRVERVHHVVRTDGRRAPSRRREPRGDARAGCQPCRLCAQQLRHAHSLLGCPPT
jgi:hypothetical protein